MIRVLVAEDSATARGLLVQILSADPEIVVVGEARDGVEAIAMTQRLRPDLVTMDIEMPRLDGLAATQEIMITAPTPIVIITGSTHAREVRVSLEALRAGALEVLVKPPGMDAPEFAAAARHLIEIVKAMAHVKVVRHWRPATLKAHVPRGNGRDRKRGRIVAAATSTGGPAALQTLFSGLPADFPVPILVVQHITVGFTAGLAAWLSSVTPFRVKLAQHGETIGAGTVYLAPDDRHLGVTSFGAIALADTPPIGGFRPSATALFESVARAYGASAVGVILTGMGDDGVAGLRLLRQSGGQVIAQDETTSVVFGMPGAAVTSGLAQAVLAIDAIAAHLLTLV